MHTEPRTPKRLPQSKPIKTGLIGYGLSGRFFHTPFIIHNPDFELTCVNTRQLQAVQEDSPLTRIENTAEGVIHADDTDLIVITSQNHLHFSQAQAALQAGKHVLLEKPSVTEFWQIEQLARLALKQGVCFCVFQNRRYDADFILLQQVLKEQQLGTWRHIDSRFDRFRPSPQQRWREAPGIGTGIFWDLGPHLLDQMLHLLGHPLRINAQLKTLRLGGETTDYFDVFFDYGHCILQMSSSPFEAGPMRRFNVRGDQGSLQLWGVDPQEAALRAGQQPHTMSLPELSAPQRVEWVSATAQSPFTLEKRWHYAQFYAQLAQAILHGDEPPVSLDDACALVYALQRCEAAAAAGQWLDWDYCGWRT